MEGGGATHATATADHALHPSAAHQRTTSDGSSSRARPSTDRTRVPSLEGDHLRHVISERAETIIPDARRSMDLDDYFSGPLDPTKHSKLPFFMRMHGSIVPKMIVPLTFIAAWTTAIVCISKWVYELAVDSLLLTVLGFVVGLALSFRVSTANERYGEGRKYWAQLILQARMLGHHIWIHVPERQDNENIAKEDLLSKLSAINLILAFAQAAKHKLRHEIEYDWNDLKPLIESLDTFSKRALPTDRTPSAHNRMAASSNRLKTWGEYLGIPFVQSNPRKAYKKAAAAKRHHGNLPYEILNHLGAFIEERISTKAFDNPVILGQMYGSFSSLMDAYGGCERVLQTPLPLAYNISISQITWLYVLVLPFQLYPALKWVTIPGTIVAAYIILGLAAIGREIEDPFGRDVNDLDLDHYCKSLQYDLNVLTAMPKPSPRDFIHSDFSMPLWPYSFSNFNVWRARSERQIREALAAKVNHQSVLLAENKAQGDVRVEEKKFGKV